MSDKKGIGFLAFLLCAAFLTACGDKAPDTAPEPAQAPPPMAPAPQSESGTPSAPAEPAAPAAPATPATPPPAAGAAAPAPAPAPAAARSGEQVYNTTCQVCHAAGIAGAPKLGDKAAWAPRIQQGMDLLVQHVIKGFTGKTGVMPPRGTCMACSDQEIRKAVEYMVSKSK